MIKLFDTPVSGNCHKARLMLSLLGLDYEKIPVNLMEREQKTPEFLALNPLGKVPVLEDDGLVIWDGQAITVYLARNYGGTDWYPDDAEGMAEVQKWLSFATLEMWEGPAIARAINLFNRPIDPAEPKAKAAAALGVLDGWLQIRDWLACGRPTVADVCVYPYAAMAWEGGVDMTPYTAMNAWIKRVEALPGYVGMPNMPRPA